MPPKSKAVNLTPQRIREAVCPINKGQAFLWDSNVKGLAVRVTKSSKAYVFQGRLPDSSEFRLKVGDCTSITLDEARKTARQHAALAAKGIDPRLEVERVAESEAAERQERNRQDLTLSEVWQTYCAARQCKWSDSYYNLHQRLIQKGGKERKRSNEKTIAGPLYPLAELKLCDLTPNRITKWLETEAPARPTQCRIAFEALRACLNWCVDHDDYRGLADPGILGPRTKREHLAPKNTRDDCLQREQLPTFFKSARNYPGKVMRAYIQTVLLTGARREEVAAIKWGDVDFRWNSLTLDGKTGRRTIPLTPYVAALLNSLPRKNEWVFAAPTAAGERMTSPTRAFQRMLERAEIEGLTIHGLRRSFSTLSEWVEAPAGVVAQIMGHQPSAIAEKHYKKRPLDLLRMWHTKIEAWILEQAGIDQPAEQSEDQPLRLVTGGKAN